MLVQLEKPLEQTASGLLLSMGSEEETQKSGIVAAVGPGKQLENGRRDGSDIEVGDRSCGGATGPRRSRSARRSLWWSR